MSGHATSIGESVLAGRLEVLRMCSERGLNGCVQQDNLLCNCCKIRESDWCILLDSAKIKSIPIRLTNFTTIVKQLFLLNAANEV